MQVPDDPLTAPHGMAILGATQSGKTAVAREMHAETPRVSVWINEQGESRVRDIARDGAPVRSSADVVDAIADREGAVELRSRNRSRDVPKLVSELWALADRTDRQLPVQVVVDEAHRVAPQSQKPDLPGRDALRRLAKEGMKRNIKLVSITQDPVSVDKQMLRQSHLRLVFPMSAESRDAVSRMGFDWSVVDEAPAYTGVLHHMTGRVLDPAVRAAEEHA